MKLNRRKSTTKRLLRTGTKWYKCIPLCYERWQQRCLTPVQHISQQQELELLIHPPLGRMDAPMTAVKVYFCCRDDTHVLVSFRNVIGNAPTFPFSPPSCVQVYKNVFAHNVEPQGGPFIDISNRPRDIRRKTTTINILEQGKKKSAEEGATGGNESGQEDQEGEERYLCENDRVPPHVIEQHRAQIQRARNHSEWCGTSARSPITLNLRTRYGR